MGTPAGQHGQALAGILLGCMEVVMEDLVEELTGEREVHADWRAAQG